MRDSASTSSAPFRRAGARTVATDVNPLAPALYHADAHVLVPRIDDPEYVPVLRRLVDEHEARLVVPRSPTSTSSRWHAGATSSTRSSSSRALTSSSGSRTSTSRTFSSRNEASPRRRRGCPQTFRRRALPLLVKARHGFGSRHIYRADDRAQLEFFLGYTPVESIVQVCLGGEEFSIDVFCDLDGRCLNAIPRTMIESKGGESIKGMTIRDERLIDLASTVAEALALVGPANIQCFREADGSHLVTDINTRFGGGFPLPLAPAGAIPSSRWRSRVASVRGRGSGSSARAS